MHSTAKMQRTQSVLLFALVAISAVAWTDVVVNASYVGRYGPDDSNNASLEISANSHTPKIVPSWISKDNSPATKSSDDTSTSLTSKVNLRVTPPKKLQTSTETISKTTDDLQRQEMMTSSSDYTTLALPTFACAIIPTTVTSMYSKTRAGPVETTATYITQTKTPTITSAVFTSCSPECTSIVASEVTETVTTAISTVIEVVYGCDTPPVVYTDTLTLVATQVLPIRNTDTVTITVTPEGPVTHETITYYIGTYAETVIENEYFECVSPPPCKGYEAMTITETSTIEATTLISSICLDNWAFFQATTTLTEFSCFNPFSVYACPEGGSCPLPITITEQTLVAVETSTLIESRPCYWQRPPTTMELMTPVSSHQQTCSVTVTVTPECPPSTPKTPSNEADEEISRKFEEIETLLEKLKEKLYVKFSEEHLTIKVYIKLINRLSNLRYHPSLRSLPRTELRRLLKGQRAMIESLMRYVQDSERVNADPNLFFDQLEDLVGFLENQPVGFTGEKRLQQ